MAEKSLRQRKRLLSSQKLIAVQCSIVGKIAVHLVNKSFICFVYGHDDAYSIAQGKPPIFKSTLGSVDS